MWCAIAASVLFLASPGFAGAAAQDDTLFVIGEPDGFAVEFGATREGYAGFLEAFPGPVEFVVGRDGPETWPFIHPASRDPWAGNRVHEFTIRWTADVAPEGELFLILGLADAHAREHSRVVVTINGVDLPAQIAPAGEQVLAYDTAAPGRVRSMIFALPVGALGAGENALAIRLEEQSWIIYDYVALRTVNEPIASAVPDVVGRALDGPLAPGTRIVFAERSLVDDPHWYANFG